MKFKHILFPVDFSERSALLKEDVESIAKRFGSRVTLLHVFEIPAAWYGTAEAPLVNLNCFQAFADGARENLAQFQLDLPSASIDRVLLEGDAAWHIGDWARQYPTDLIMMGSHGHGRLQGLLLGSVAAKVMHDAPCPVWTHCGSGSNNGRIAGKIQNVLCCVDIDSETIPLLRFAKDIGSDFSAKVQVVHCVPEAETRPNKYFDIDLHRYLVEGARVELTRMQRDAGTQFEISILDGTIAKSVREFALKEGSDLILLGKGKSQQLFGRLRTHAYQIIHEAPCPVLSYSPLQPGRISSSYSAGRHAQFSEPAPFPTGSSLHS